MFPRRGHSTIRPRALHITPWCPQSRRQPSWRWLLPPGERLRQRWSQGQVEFENGDAQSRQRGRQRWRWSVTNTSLTQIVAHRGASCVVRRAVARDARHATRDGRWALRHHFRPIATTRNGESPAGVSRCTSFGVSAKISVDEHANTNTPPRSTRRRGARVLRTCWY